MPYLVAEAELEGIKAAGGDAKIFQYVLSSPILCRGLIDLRIPETLPQNVLDLLHAPPKPDYPIIDADTLATFDAFIIGIPTRYGNFPGQWKVCTPCEHRRSRLDSNVLRRSGTLLAGFGPREPSLASTLVSSSPPPVWVEDRRALLSPRNPLSLIMASSTSLLGTPRLSASSPT